MTKEPINHHYVPQHFLKEWSLDKLQIIRYRHIHEANKFEVKKVAIKNTSSENELYRITLPDGSFEIEESVLNKLVDQPGQKAIKLARKGPIKNLKKEDKVALYKYIAALEARHPDILDAMNIHKDLDKMRKELKSKDEINHKAIDELINYFKSSKNLGAIAFSQLIHNENNGLISKPLWISLDDSYSIEIESNENDFITSNYPVSRWGDYDKSIFIILAISPKKALVFSKDRKIHDLVKLPQRTLINLVNLYTIGKATNAYHSSDSATCFIKKHLSWAKNKSLKDQQKYVKQFLEVEIETTNNNHKF